jgi:hypothetical protein
VEVLKPEVVMVKQGNNVEAMNGFVCKLVKERGFIHLDCSKLGCHSEKKILYNNPNNKKFVLSNFSEDLCVYK